MSVVSEHQRSATREQTARVRSTAKDEVRRLEHDKEAVLHELGRFVAEGYSGEPVGDAVAEVEAELDEVERELRRARAALVYVAD